MNNNSKDYYIKNIERGSEVNKDLNRKIRNNIIFSIAGFILAGVAFGIGNEIFGSTTLQYITAFSGVGITSANIRALRENLSLKSGKTTVQDSNSIEQSKGKAK